MPFPLARKNQELIFLENEWTSLHMFSCKHGWATFCPHKFLRCGGRGGGPGIKFSCDKGYNSEEGPPTWRPGEQQEKTKKLKKLQPKRFKQIVFSSYLGLSWGYLGTLLGLSWRLLGPLGLSWGSLGTLLNDLEGIKTPKMWKKQSWVIVVVHGETHFF